MLMLRTNLSTRPFYNERSVHLAAAIVALLVVAVAAWQGARIVRLSRYKTELRTSIARDRSEAGTRRQEAAQIRRGVDQKELTRVMTQAKEANTLIQQRTFSWTELFNRLEATLPEDVMLISIHPEFKDGVTAINLELQGRSSDANESFFDRLEQTGAFHNVEWSQLATTEEGLDRISARMVYTPVRPAAKPAAAVMNPRAPGGRR
jgi:Tfp pilus assembly protein PilN